MPPALCRPTSEQRLPRRVLVSLGLWFALCSAAGAAPAATAASEPWWRHAVIYEIYPRSFQDSNGDGVGDLNGITQRLDYLEALGVDAIWIAPIYPSPQVDFGYDISDYEAVDPQYGTLADFDRLLARGARRTTSASSSTWCSITPPTSTPGSSMRRARALRDSMTSMSGAMARPDAAGKPLPPNNWVSLFGGSAWAVRAGGRSVLLPQVLPPAAGPQLAQPAGRAGDVRRDALLARSRCRGLPPRRHHGAVRGRAAARRAGARRASMPRATPILSDIYTNNLPEVHGVMRRMRAMTDSYPGERVLIGETYVPKTADLDPWYGGARHDELQLPMDTAGRPGQPARRRHLPPASHRGADAAARLAAAVGVRQPRQRAQLGPLRRWRAQRADRHASWPRCC